MHCRARAEEFFRSIADWLGRQSGANGRVRQPEIVANTAQPGIGKTGPAGERARRHVGRRKRTDGFHLGPRSADRALAGQLERWRTQQTGRRGVLGRAERLAPRPGTLGFVRGADRCRAGAARNFVRSDADGRAHQRHVVGRRSGQSSAAFDFYKSRVGLTQAGSLRLGSPVRLSPAG